MTRATYHQIWWPQMSSPVYVDQLPVWDGLDYLDPRTGVPLQTWADALAELEDDENAQPAHVIRFGRQLDVQGLLAGTPDADRSVRYLTKYLTKAVGETYADQAQDSSYEAHIDRLHDEVRWLPCSPDCANWLRFGVQPRKAGPGLVPGRCLSKAHDREHLGVGGRRVLVSRGWSGKTLADHKADRAAVVREALEAAGIEVESARRMAAEVEAADGGERFVWAAVVCHQGTSAAVLMETVLERRRWREQYEYAKSLAGADPPVDSRSATAGDDRDEGSRMSDQALAEDRLWSVEDASYYLGVPVQTLYSWRGQGVGPPGRRVGRRLRYRPEDVKDWVAGLSTDVAS